MSTSVVSLACAVLALAAPALTQTTNYSTNFVPMDLVYQYQPPTWVENLALRPNGNILPITTTSPLLNQLDPKTGALRLVHDFSAYGNAIQGITTVGEDVFVVNILTCDILETLACTPGSVTSWAVEFCAEHGKEKVRVHKVAAFLDAGFLNGIAALSEETVLMADSYLGGIWSLSLTTGATELLFTDEAMNGTAGIATGINGLRVRPEEGLLYFTNSAKGTFNRIPISPATGQKAGAAQTIASGLAGPDDFEIDGDAGVAYVCNGALDQVLRVPLDGAEIEVAAEVPGPTSVRWDVGGEKRAYVSTIGGLQQYIGQNVTVGGAVYALEV